ncbi:MAG TPA: hypothetical protein VKR30_09160 [Candidatus Limnocylindrales bacterium]|nr:hypothetical protein [Candidatus Limnocylindrales bacterium]
MRYIVAAYADAEWVADARAAGGATLSRGGRDEAVILDEIPISDRGRAVVAFFEQVRGGVRLFGDRSSEEIAADATRHPVFRVQAVPALDPRVRPS